MDNLAVANILPVSNAAPAAGLGLGVAGDSAAGLSAEGAFGELLSKQIALLDPLEALTADVAELPVAASGLPAQVLVTQPIDPSVLIQQITTPLSLDTDGSEDDEIVVLGDASASLAPADLSVAAIVVPLGNLPPSSAVAATIAGKDLPPVVANITLAPQAAVTDEPAVTTNLQEDASDEFNAALAAKIGGEKSRISGSGEITQNQSQIQVQPNIATQAQTANAAPASAGIPQQVGAPHWDTGLGDKVVWMLGTQTKVAELHLNPPALGPLEVRISIADGQANLSFMTQHNAVGDAIESAKARLREMMGESGINMGNVSVNVGSFAQQQQQQTQQQGSQTPDGKTVTDIAWLPEGEGEQSVTATVQSLHDRGLVDLFA